MRIEGEPVVLLQAVAFGMGGGLLQRVNRDTMSFATKLSHIVYKDGTTADLMKAPKSDPSKASLPGVLAVRRIDGVPTAFPADAPEMLHAENLLQVVYDGRPCKVRVKILLDQQPNVCM